MKLREFIEKIPAGAGYVETESGDSVGQFYWGEFCLSKQVACSKEILNEVGSLSEEIH